VNLIGSYNHALVALSVLIAIFASYAALDLAGRVTAAGGWTRALWLLGGAGAMGTGIWSMHYIGMLAFILPIPVAYHWPTVLLSLFAAILASVVALSVVSRQKMGWFRALAGSVLMGAGIASMHYIGMAAMRLPAICQFNSFLVVLSVVLAVLISLAALWITFHFRDEKTGIGWEKLTGAVVMGVAIPVMHYTGMAAASFTPSGTAMDLSHAVSISTLGTAGIAAVTFIVLGLALLTSLVDRRLATQTLEVQEKKLQQSEAYLSEAQGLSHTGSFGWRVSTGETIWSEETFRIFQYDRSTKPTVELVLQRVHPEDAVVVQQTIERAAQDGKDFDFEHRLLMEDGSVKHLHVVAHAERDESGEIEFVGAVMDVSDHKRAQEELRRSEALAEQRLRLVVDTTPAMINSCRPDGYLDYVNKGWLDYLGFSLETALDRAGVMKMSVPSGANMYGGDWQPIIYPEDLPGFTDQWKATLASGKQGEFEARVRRFDGVYRWHLFRAVPLCDETGKPVKWYASAFDIEDRKRAEEALRRSESYLAEAQRLSHTGSWAWAPATDDIRYWSEECYRVLGFDPHKGLPRVETFFQRIHPDDQVRSVQQFERASREKTEFEFDYRIVHPGGDVRDIHTVGHPVFSPSGDLLEFVGTVIDITERKRAEDRTRLIIDTVPAQLWTESPEGVVDFVNRRWVDYTGMTLEQAVGWGWTGMVHPDDIERVLTKWRTLISEGKPREIESRLRRSDGEYRWFLSRVCPLVDRSGHILGWYGSDTDIHDRKEAEDKLRQSEAHLQEAQTVGRIGSWVFNVAAGTVSASPELFRIFGRDPEVEQLTKKMLSEVRPHPIFRASIHPEDRPFVEEFANAARNENKAQELEYRIVLPDGSGKYVYSVAHPVFDNSGSVVEYIGTIMDVTERKRAEEAVRQAQAELAHVSRVTTMGELTASLAHEVNQPIAAAVTNANTCLRWLTRDHPDVEEARAAAMRIVKDGTRAAEIIKRIRLLFKKGTPEWELVDVNEVIREMTVLLRSEAARYVVSIGTNLATDIPQVMADRVQLQQVLMNLMLNGIDAMKDVYGTRELAIQSQRSEAGQVLVSVNDTGVGLPVEQADQIFKAFFTTKPQGTGMGLSISRSIVESHGGRLWAAENFPHGASFCFTLPTRVEEHE
jgi:PAS domain S-box-containing protein